MKPRNGQKNKLPRSMGKNVAPRRAGRHRVQRTVTSAYRPSARCVSRLGKARGLVCGPGATRDAVPTHRIEISAAVDPGHPLTGVDTSTRAGMALDSQVGDSQAVRSLTHRGEPMRFAMAAPIDSPERF